jgi:ABC-type polysaccharide/polyol phosphate export permease
VAGDLRELWAFRELLFVLTMRDIKVRYKHTVLGAAWAILIVFTVSFGLVFCGEGSNLAGGELVGMIGR